MSEFNWNDHPIVSGSPKSANGFSWDDHPIIAPAKQPGQTQAALESFGNGASMGYLPQLQAAAEPVTTAIGNFVTGSNVQPDDYLTARDANIRRQAEQAAANPTTAAIAKGAGTLTTGVATAGVLPEAGAATTVVGKIAQSALQGARVGTIYGALENPGDKQGEIDPLQLKQRVENAGKGLAGGAATGAILPIAIAGAKVVANTGSAGLKALAEKAAVNATGATGKQISKFEDNAGRELLDRGIVKFGDNQEQIAKRASEAVSEANGMIDSALQKLKDQGVTVDAEAIKSKIADRIKELAKNSSTSDIRAQLQREMASIDESIAANGGKNIDILTGEETKRGYARKAGNWMDPEKGQAGKELYGQYRTAVEDAATSADPTLAGAFKKGKESYGILAPIQEAAERRAQTQGQSPWGGLGDTVAAIKGMMVGGPAGALASVAGRRMISPRLASSAAVTADAAANLLRRQPGMAELETKFPAVFQGIVQHITDDTGSVQKVADQPNKGPAKWANDGLQNLQDHAGQEDKDTLDKAKGALLSDPSTQTLLVAASDLKPGTKAMQNILDRVKAKIARTDK